MSVNITKHSSIRTKVMLSFFLALLPIYFLGFAFLRWGNIQMRKQIINSQRSRLNLYAATIDSELARIQSLQYDCINDVDILYLANAYSIMDSFERSQYMLRAQHRIQVMKNSSLCISDVVIHFPTIGRTISTRCIESLNPRWESLSESLNSTNRNGIKVDKDGNLQFIMQYPNFRRDDRLPCLVMEIHLSRQQLQNILQGFDIDNQTGFLFTGLGGDFKIERSDNESFLSYAFQDDTKAHPLEDEVTIDGNHYQINSVCLSDFDMYLVAFSSTDSLFQFNHIYTIFLLIFSLVAVATMVAFAASMRYLVHEPIRTLTNAFAKIKENDFNVRIHKQRKDEFAYLYDSFNAIMDYLQQLIEQVYQQQLLAQRSELKQLQAQINPHFLYNGFYSIYRMAKENDDEEIATFSQLLSQYYQYITRNAADEVPMEDEIKHAVTYLKIQQTRFSNRLKVHIGEVPSIFSYVNVPRLIIQPLLENAFEHGLKDTLEPAIELDFNEDSAFYYVYVKDNGNNISRSSVKELTQKTHNLDPKLETTALVNIHRRLYYRFGNDSGLYFNTDSNYFIVEMKISKEVRLDQNSGS